MTDGLDEPLGGKAKQKRKAVAMPRLKRPAFGKVSSWPWGRIGLMAVLVCAAALAARIAIVEEPDGGRPTTEVMIASSGKNQVAEEVAISDPAPEASAAETKSTTGDGPEIITVDDNLPDGPMTIGVAELSDFGVLPDLAEETRDGPIPRIGPQGETAFKAYARASITPDSAGGRSLIAILVTGLGLNEASTMNAIEKLPDAVTLGFAPYGSSLQKTTSAARAGGHELMLEVPLEPFDYPQNDPGPQTLLTGQPARANLDKLFWLMARMGGYVGVVNYMGARFTASAADMGPLMEELGTRGLGYLDDGSSNRSVAASLAHTNKVPFSRASLEIDASPARVDILAALQTLEDRARENGSAIGVASALPVTLQILSEWSAGLEDKDIVLVPVSALMAAP